MTRKHLTGLLLAAATMTVGTLAVVNAQDEPKAAAEEHDHDHSPTTVHAADGTGFELDNEEAYPDADGFKSMKERISYAIGRSDATQLPIDTEAGTQTFGEGVRKGMTEQQRDYAIGYSQGFQLSRSVLSQGEDDEDKIDMDAFIAGMTAAIKEKKKDYALGYTQGYEITQTLLAEEEDLDVDKLIAGITKAVKEEDENRAIGYLVGNSYRESEMVQIEAESYLAGISEALAALEAAAAEFEAEEPADGEAPKPKPDKPKTKLTQEQVGETLRALNAYIQAKQRDDAIAEGQEYIDQLKAEDGWKKTESGIAYKVVQAGEGKSPDENDVVTMNYEGSLLDGTVFDSSYERDQPLVYAANRLIPGWTEVLQMMKPGSVYEVVIPQELAYGEVGSPPNIPPYSTLKFKMQMIGFEEIENAPAQPAPKPQGE